MGLAGGVAPTRRDLLTPLSAFGEACSAVLDHLNGVVPLESWVVARAVGDDWVVLSSCGDRRALGPGATYRWSDTICSRMVSGRGPRSASRVSEVAAYSLAPLARELPVGAYVGAELVDSSGAIFGTLCGLHPTPLAELHMADVARLVVLNARLLSGILAVAERASDSGRQDERLTRSIQSDPMTGLLDRSGWDALLADEERRFQILGLPAGVVVIELPGLRELTNRGDLAYGERTLRECADILRGATRRTDSAARIGETDFAVLLPDCGPLHIEQVANRIRDGFARRGIQASVGSAERDPRRDLASAVNGAATARYQGKRR